MWRWLDVMSRKREEAEERRSQCANRHFRPERTTSDLWPLELISSPDLFFCYIACLSYTCVTQPSAVRVTRAYAVEGGGVLASVYIQSQSANAGGAREARIADWYSTWYSNTQHSRHSCHHNAQIRLEEHKEQNRGGSTHRRCHASPPTSPLLALRG